MVACLRQQVQDLKEELSMATGEDRTDELTDEQKRKLSMFDLKLHPFSLSQLLVFLLTGVRS